MEHLKNKLKKRLAQKFLGRQAIGVLVERELRKLYPDVQFDAYVKFDKLFVQSSDRALQITFFRDKQRILKSVNDKLAGLEYEQRIHDVIFKPGKFQEAEEPY